MGTNYYLVKKLEDVQVIKAILLLISHDYQGVKDMLPEEIHIGKSSSGWQFTFDHNNWEHFEKSRKSVEKFLKSGTIYCEYGERVSLEEFWEKVKSKKGGMYSKEHSSKVEGLVFFNHTDFS